MRVTTIAVILACTACTQEPGGSSNDKASDRALQAPALPEVMPGRNTLFVNIERVQRRTCPDMTCGEVGWISERQLVTAMEQRNDWVRITDHYDAACENGVSQYVDEGRATCTRDNGIVDGKLAEWVPMSALSKERPADPAKTATSSEAIVAQSDDFKRYRTSFAKVAKQLIAEGRCTEDDFLEMGGWLKSVTEYKNEPVYFTYCGGMTVNNKIYMNAETGKVI